MVTTDIPERQHTLDRVTQLIPVLRKYAAWSEENRRPHDEAIEALADAGIFKLRRPARYGGYEADTRTLVDVGAELARADGAIAWIASVYWIPTWMAGLFPDEVQDEVFSTPDMRMCGTVSPGGMARKAPGGVVVNGSWGFVSGAHHSHWQEIVAVLVEPDAEPMPIMALVPMTDLEIVDDWHTSGLRGTGSVTTVAREVFIPAARVLPLPMALEGQSASKANAGAAMYRAPLLAVASASSVGSLFGLADAAREVFFERLPDRKITYTDYTHQNEAPLTHVQVADAAMKIDEAGFHAHRVAELVDGKCAAGSPWSTLERVRARADMGAAVRLADEAVGILASASGGSSIYQDVPMQRIRRDIEAGSLHALMHPDTNAELYGRVLCGQEPNSRYI